MFLFCKTHRWRFISLGLTAGLCLAFCQVGSGQTPSFLIETPSGGWYVYNQDDISDSLVDASVTLDGDFYTLDLEANSGISSISFPYEAERVPLDDNLSDDIYYFPILGGGTVQAPFHDVDYNWYGARYPGEIFSPLVVTADDDNARIVAAANWPPRTVEPYYAAQRVKMTYEVELTEGDQFSGTCLIAEVSADPSTGEAAWRKALDVYRAWLDSHVETPGYPEVLVDAHGYFFIGLTDWPEFELSEISENWAQWRDRLPWMQFWGQMSNYAGPPQFAVPPLEQGEITDCCYADPQMHPRYLPELLDFVADSITGLGYLGGYYASPYYDLWGGNPQLFLDTEAGVGWLSQWLDKNEFDYGANAFYIDILGRRYWGNPVEVLDLFETGLIRENTMIEGLVDIYPAAGLISGYLTGMFGFPGGPGITPQNSADSSFPSMLRYLLNDRMVFLGPSNGDAVFMGLAGDYWLERQTFLLGAKYEVSHPNNDWNPATPNPILTMALDLRDEHSWWQRWPRYMDTEGITGIPDGVEVRRFDDDEGCQLFAIENWGGQSGLSFSFLGETYGVPTDQLSIIDGCAPLGLESSSHELALNAFPNPATSEVWIKTETALNNADLVLTNVHGQEIKRFSDVSGRSVRIDLTGIADGFYLLSCFPDHQGSAAKIIVLGD